MGGGGGKEANDIEELVFRQKAEGIEMRRMASFMLVPDFSGRLPQFELRVLDRDLREQSHQSSARVTIIAARN